MARTQQSPESSRGILTMVFFVQPKLNGRIVPGSFVLGDPTSLRPCLYVDEFQFKRLVGVGSFLARNTNENLTSQTRRPLATSSLAHPLRRSLIPFASEKSRSLAKTFSRGILVRSTCGNSDDAVGNISCCKFFEKPQIDPKFPLRPRMIVLLHILILISNKLSW